MNSPEVSVILPTYNRAHIVARAIRSVLSQTFADFELIVVDDASTDNTEHVVSSFEDRRIRYIRRDLRGGPAAARNSGINIARASWVAFQDSDDEWLSEKLSRQIAVARRQGAETALVCCGYKVISRNGSVYYKTADARMQAGDWAPDNIYDFSFITPTWLARREALVGIGLFDESLTNLEDWELVFRLFQRHKIIAVNENLVVKHGCDDSVYLNKQSRSLSLQRILDRHKAIWKAHPSVLARLYSELGGYQCMAGDIQSGRANLWKALRYDSHVSRNWIKWMASCFGYRAYSYFHKMASRYA